MTDSHARRNLIARQKGQHCHDFSQILIGWKGQMACEFTKGAGQITNGTVAVVPSSAEHFFTGLSDDSELLVIDLAPVDPFIQALEQACNLSFKDTLFRQPEFLSLNPELLPMLDFAANQLAHGEAHVSRQVNCQLISLFMTQLCQEYSSTTQTPKDSRLNTTELNRFIDRRLANPPSNAELAKSQYLSESHFYYLCQQTFGVTPQQYVMSRRMHRAHFLLQNTKYPLAVLAAELGFSDSSSFSRAFKKFFQITPGKARR
ncbi:AraC family transcriptional regulator [Aliamphritea hakodatensis]|uniref:AraC family transcriptional regulator n=1 Tax=Aliamphritea hakodatensis TaxID=2895352 RepID=UPI0022FD7319|nr:AraC family transcriptional regulator [Aliamphritea hakodatensis]